ncbi:hypothetical protein Tco_1292095 [Tanacetum coccineum]
MAQQPMRSEEELCPTNKRFESNKSNARIDLEETQDEPLFDISLEILKYNIIYNAITLTMEVPKIYMQQFWHTAFKNEKNKKGQGKGLMRRSDMEVNPPKSKKQKDAVSRHSRIITFADNVLPDTDEAFKQSKESKKQSILEEIKRKTPREGSGAARESLDHNDSFDFFNDGKTESERDSDHEESDSDSEHGDESDKFNNDEENVESENDEYDQDYDNDEDQTADFVLKPHDKEPEQTQPEP